MKPLMFIFIILLYLGANFYVFYRIWQAVPPNIISKIVIICFAVFSVLALVLSLLLRDSMPIGITSVLYKWGTSWLFIMIYFVIVFLVKDLIVLANQLLHFMPSDAISRYTKDNWVGLGFMVGFITLLMVCGYFKYQWKVKVDLPIFTQKSIGAYDSIKVVGISDLHLGYAIGDNELKKWVDKINAEQADIILIAGDLIDNSVRPLNANEKFVAYLNALQAKKGVYMCFGNHEYLSGASESIDFLKKTNIKVLRDDYVEIDSTLYIVGRDDRSNLRRKPLKDLVSTLDKNKPIILLDHQPYNLNETEENGIDIQFSGHTHQGQVWPISLITESIYETDHGFIKKGNANIYVSSGIGIWGGKFRIGTQSEYVVFNIKKQ